MTSKLSALLLFAVVVALLAACGSPDSDSTAVPPPAPTETGTPIPEQTEATVVPEQYDFNVSEGDIEALKTAPFTEFIDRPVGERMLVTMFYAQDMPEFAADWYGISKNPLDQLPATISENNTPQEIATLITYLHRMPYTLTQEENDFYLDTNAAARMIAGAFIDPNSDDSLYYLQAIDGFAGNTAAPSARSLAVSDYILATKADAENSSDLLTDDNGNPYRTVRLTQGDGSVLDVTAHWVQAKNGTGMWVQGETVVVQ